MKNSSDSQPSDSKKGDSHDGGQAKFRGWDKRWHMSTNAGETNLTEIELALFRNYAAFTRWMDDCAACCHTSEVPCNGMDYAILNMIRMHERSKSISEIARLMNRDDTSNIQYSIKKLIKAELIEKLGADKHKRGASYQVTQAGVVATDDYASIRRKLLLPLIDSIRDGGEKTDQVAKVLSLLSGIYDQAACVAASHRIPHQD